MTPRTPTPSRPRSHAPTTAGASARVVVENVNHPGARRAVDGAKYQAMRRAILRVLPSRSPGLTLAQLSTAMLPHLPDSLFPGGAQAGWWLKTVQLDLEAKQMITREKVTPLRLFRS